MGAVTPPDELRYPLHDHTLPNGLRVVINPEHHAPVVAVNLWYGVGSRDEDPGRTGLAHLFEHVMFQGSEHVASGEHFDLLQAAGATGNATTWFDRTNYFEAVPTGALELALWLEADRMGRLLPALTQANLDNQREVVKEEKRQRYDNAPYGDTIARLLPLAFPAEHPYGHTVIGSMADLDAATLEDAHAFFQRWYSPANAVLTLSGDVDPDRGLALAERHFGPLSARSHPTRPAPPSLPPTSGVPRDSAAGDVPAAQLYLQWRTPPRSHPDADAVDIALSILGGSETSRLYRTLVRDSDLASSAGAGALPLAVGNSLSHVFARARDGVDLSALEDACLTEIQRLAEDGPTDAELHRVHVQFEREWLTDASRLESRADLISGLTMLDGDPQRLNRRVTEVVAVDAAAVRGATRRWLAPEARAVLEYRPTTKGTTA
jgi:zinc protease